MNQFKTVSISRQVLHFPMKNPLVRTHVLFHFAILILGYPIIKEPIAPNHLIPAEGTIQVLLPTSFQDVSFSQGFGDQLSERIILYLRF